MDNDTLNNPSLEPEVPPPPRTIRCGVAGVGSLGQHHARIYAAMEHCELVGIYEVNDARAAESLCD